ncbi:hypothetical protein ABNB59_06395 [Paenibacillus larvae]|nr:hypothetical protein [Paenibacillus larvae]UYL93396.1 hypothetical protein LILO_50 [Paenibacillus phage Lilo]AQR77462.1 hypothetical protein BXP28_08975 [Paenibacillus larvae subsp. larvae]AVF21505.1 hypothetical protein ERICI_01627 [Paenibacillus larvae subsp. larvae]AVG11430.1 hypothetical protein ERICII_01011 [Paenibacillus larvae subsp. larvae DSM 25430]ETK30295.1 hypothetical protein ERIC1_1c38620 [Paenibacillus larvae subsp. larvae DSM 25719]
MELITHENMMQRRESGPPAEALVSRQAQEVQAAVFMAKKFPRDEYMAYDRLMKSCERVSLAESALYEYPRGGQKISGPSIRLAEAIAQAWGNMDFGVIELEQRNGSSSMMAYAWDLENNTRQTKIFTVKHERKARGKLDALHDPRDIYEMTANQGARRVRSCILAVIPGDVVEAAVEKCKQTLKNGYKEPLEDRIRKMISAFREEFQVSKEMIEQFIGCAVEAFTDNDFVRLRSVYKSLRDHMAKREDYFDIPKPKSETDSPLNREEENEANQE